MGLRWTLRPPGPPGRRPGITPRNDLRAAQHVLTAASGTSASWTDARPERAAGKPAGTGCARRAVRPPRSPEARSGPNRLGPVAATGLRWTLRPPGPPGRRPGLTVRRSAGGMPRSYGCMRCLGHPGRMPALNGQRASRLGPAVPGGLYARRARQRLAPGPNRLGPVAGHRPPLDAPASRASWTSARYHCATICGRQCHVLTATCRAWHPERLSGRNLSLDDVLSVSRGFLLPPIRTPLEGGVFGCPSWTTGPRRDDDSDVPSEEKK